MGMDPTTAAEDALKRINQYYPEYSGALVTLNISGSYGQIRSWFEITVQHHSLVTVPT